MNNSDMYVKMKNHKGELKLNKFIKYYGSLNFVCVCVCVCVASASILI